VGREFNLLVSYGRLSSVVIPLKKYFCSPQLTGNLLLYNSVSFAFFVSAEMFTE